MVFKTNYGEHSAILLTFIRLSFVIKIFALFIFEWPFYTGFNVPIWYTERQKTWGLVQNIANGHIYPYPAIKIFALKCLLLITSAAYIQNALQTTFNHRSKTMNPDQTAPKGTV